MYSRHKKLVTRLCALSLSLCTVVSCMIPAYAVDEENEENIISGTTLSTNNTKVSFTISMPNGISSTSSISNTCSSTSSCTYDEQGNMTCCSNTNSNDCNSSTKITAKDCTNGCTHEGPCTYDEQGNMTCCSSETSDKDNTVNSTYNLPSSNTKISKESNCCSDLYNINSNNSLVYPCNSILAKTTYNLTRNVISSYNLTKAVSSNITLPEQYASALVSCNNCGCKGYGYELLLASCSQYTEGGESYWSSRCGCTAIGGNMTNDPHLRHIYLPYDENYHETYTFTDMFNTYESYVKESAYFNDPSFGGKCDYTGKQLSQLSSYFTNCTAYDDYHFGKQGNAALTEGKVHRVDHASEGTGWYWCYRYNHSPAKYSHVIGPNGYCVQCLYDAWNHPCGGDGQACDCGGSKGDNCKNPYYCSCTVKPPCTGCSCNGDKGDVCTNAADCSLITT